MVMSITLNINAIIFNSETYVLESLCLIFSKKLCSNLVANNMESIAIEEHISITELPSIWLYMRPNYFDVYIRKYL